MLNEIHEIEIVLDAQIGLCMADKVLTSCVMRAFIDDASEV